MAENPINRLDFVFPSDTFESSDNGLIFNDIKIPEEMLFLILSFVPGEDILKMRLVCKSWYNAVKTPSLWHTKYIRKYKKKPKVLPWYIYHTLFSTKWFTENLLKNNCGTEGLEHWKVVRRGRAKFAIEENDEGCDPYPMDDPDFGGASTCFVSSHEYCEMKQEIPLPNLMKYIVHKHAPKIYASEWVCCPRDCSGDYFLTVELYRIPPDTEVKVKKHRNYWYFLNVIKRTHRRFHFERNQIKQWIKNDLIVDYSRGYNIDGISFHHAAYDDYPGMRDYYGPKMAGGVVRCSFDSILEV